MAKHLKGYKGFGQGLICRDKQYKENTVFEEEKAIVCSKGMHFCTNPLDVLDYYDLVNEDGTFSEYTEVEALADSVTDDNKKYCTTKLKIGVRLGFAGFIKACVNFLIEKTSFQQNDINSGNYAKIGSSGDYAKIGSSGYSAQIGSSGDYAKIGSSGDYAKIGSSGNSAKITSSGYSAQIGSSGNYAKIGSSGNSAKIGSSGDYAKIGSSGDYAKITSSGENSVVMAAGYNSYARAKKGSWITLAEWVRTGEYDKKGNTIWIPKCVKTEYVDGERIKEDTFYKLKDGEFVER